MSNSVLNKSDVSVRKWHDNEDDHLLNERSSNCKTYHHNQCSGKTNRNESRICMCYCHNSTNNGDDQ